MKVKMFGNAGNILELEEEINEWLRKNEQTEVAHIKQDYSYVKKADLFYTIISIWYEEIPDE